MAPEKDDKDQTPTAGFPVGLLVFIVSPLTMLSMFGVYFAFSKLKIKLSVIFWCFFVPILLLVAIFWQFSLENFIQSFTQTVPKIFETQNNPNFWYLLLAMLQQAPLAIPAGVLVGLFYSWTNYRNRPDWLEEPKYRLTPIQIWKKRKTIKDISLGRNNPTDGMTLGVSDEGKRLVQTYEESVGHTLIVGAVGSGKTRTIVSRIRDDVKNGQAICLIDLKGDPKLAQEVGDLAFRNDRPFYHFLMQPKQEEYHGPALNGPAHYDPIGRGDPTRRKDLLIATRNWSEEHYKIQTSSILQLVMSVIVANPDPSVSTLTDVTRLLDPLELKKRSLPLSGNPNYSDIIHQIDTLVDKKIDPNLKSAINGFASQLSVLLNSVAGPWLKKDPTNTNNIDLMRAALNQEVIVFTLDSSNYEDQSRLIANLIIQDLKTVSSELRRYQNGAGGQRMSIIVDEFSAIGSDNVLGLINKSRDARMPVTLSTQTLADLNQESHTLREQLLGIVNSYIIHRTNLYSDAEELASLAGKVTKKRLTENVSYTKGLFGGGAGSGKGNIVDVEEYNISPGDIQKLKTLEFFYLNKNPMRFVKGKGVFENTDLIDNGKAEDKKFFVLRTEPVAPVIPDVTPVVESEELSGDHYVLSYPKPDQEQPTPHDSTTPNPIPFPTPSGQLNMERLKKVLNRPEELLKPTKDNSTPAPATPIVKPPAFPTPPLKTPGQPGTPKPLPKFPPKPLPVKPEPKDVKEIKDDFDF